MTPNDPVITSASKNDTVENRSPTLYRIIRWRLAFVILLCLAMAFYFGQRLWLWKDLSAARRQIQAGRSAAVIPDLKRITVSFPHSAEAHYLLAVALRRSGRLDQVSEPLKRAKSLGWSRDDVERQFLLAVAQDGNIDTVDPLLKSMMISGVADDAAEEIYEALAIGYLKSYRISDAWKCLNSWSAWQPNAIFPKFWRADICRRLDNRSGEEAEYREILKLDPHHQESRRLLGNLLRDAGRLEEAQREYEQLLAEGQTTPAVLLGLAECHRRQTQVSKSIPLLERALTLSPTDAERSAILLELGDIDIEEGRADAALVKLEEAGRLAPFQAGIQYSLSKAHRQLGDPDKAEKHMKRTEEIRRGQGRVDEILQLIAKNPDNAELRYEAGKIMLDLGLKNEGIDWLRAALRIQPTHLSAQVALQAALAGHGQSTDSKHPE